jgi:hypothetical protein
MAMSRKAACSRGRNVSSRTPSRTLGMAAHETRKPCGDCTTRAPYAEVRSRTMRCNGSSSASNNNNLSCVVRPSDFDRSITCQVRDESPPGAPALGETRSRRWRHRVDDSTGRDDRTELNKRRLPYEQNEIQKSGNSVEERAYDTTIYARRKRR